MKFADTQAIAFLTGRTPNAIRIWASRGKLQRHGHDRRGRTLYNIEDATRLAVELDNRRARQTHSDRSRTTAP